MNQMNGSVTYSLRHLLFCGWGGGHKDILKNVGNQTVFNNTLYEEKILRHFSNYLFYSTVYVVINSMLNQIVTLRWIGNTLDAQGND